MKDPPQKNQPPTDQQIIKRLCRNQNLVKQILNIDRSLSKSIKKQGWRLTITGNHEKLSDDLAKLDTVLDKKQLKNLNFKKLRLKHLETSLDNCSKLTKSYNNLNDMIRKINDYPSLGNHTLALYKPKQLVHFKKDNKLFGDDRKVPMKKVLKKLGYGRKINCFSSKKTIWVWTQGDSPRGVNYKSIVSNVTDKWCNQNCNYVTQNCPTNICVKSSVQPTNCAPEGKTCQCKGIVYYTTAKTLSSLKQQMGETVVENKYNPGSDSIACGNQGFDYTKTPNTTIGSSGVFTDPKPGVPKYCWCFPDSKQDN